MKRFFSVSVVLLSVYSVFAYEDADITNANFLASENIIFDQSQSPDKYNLDAKILRQEVIGMALKIKGITLPENYTCKGYYSDTTNNSWVCRAIEIAADDGMITRGNNQANPGKYVTRAEALAMLMNAGGLAEELTTEDGPPLDREDEYIFENTNEWQKNLITKALIRGVINAENDVVELYSEHQYWNTYHVTFYPDRPATRAEVFGFASKILTQGHASKSYLEYLAPNDYMVEYEKGMKTYVEDTIRYFEDNDVIYTVAKQPLICPQKICTAADFGVKTSFGNSTKILKTEHEEFSNADVYTVKITTEGSNVLGYIRIIPDFEGKMIYKLQALTTQENFIAQKERLQRFIQSIDFYQGADLSSFDPPSVSPKEKELIAKTADNFRTMIKVGHIKTFQEYVNKSGVEATYEEALDMLGFAKSTIRQIEELIGKKIDLGKEILSSDTEWTREESSEGIVVYARFIRLKYTLRCRFDEVDGVWYLTGMSEGDSEGDIDQERKNLKILQTYLATELKTMAADPEKATVEMCFQIFEHQDSSTDAYLVYEIHNAICGGAPETSPHYGDFYVMDGKLYKETLILDGEGEYSWEIVN